METTSSSSLSIESFSYSWLVNLKPSVETLDNNSSLRASLDASADEASFIEMDPKMTPSKRFFIRRRSQDFKFDFPSSPSPLGLVHADELISNGYLMPLFLDQRADFASYYEPSTDSADQNSLPSSSRDSPSVAIDNHPGLASPDCSSLRRSCRRMSKRILHKYLNFLRPLYRRIRGTTGHNSTKPGSKSSGLVVEKVGKSRVYYSETASPRISVAFSAPDEYCWRNSCDSDSSIYEAVLHCKRSIGN